MPYARKVVIKPRQSGKTMAAEVAGLHTLPTLTPQPVHDNLMKRPGFHARLLDWHIRLNRISGDMVVAFKDGLTETQICDMSRKMQILGMEMDPVLGKDA